MLYLVIEKKDKNLENLPSILADNYGVCSFVAGGEKAEIDSELIRKIFKEEVEIDDVLIITKNEKTGKYIPLRYATLDYPLNYDIENPTDPILSTDEYLSKDTSYIDFSLDLLDYANVEDIDKFNEHLKNINFDETKKVFLEEGSDILDELDLDVTEEYFEGVVDSIDIDLIYLYIEDLTDEYDTLKITAINKENENKKVVVLLNNGVVKEEVIKKMDSKEFIIKDLKVTDDDVLIVKIDDKIIYGK